MQKNILKALLVGCVGIVCGSLAAADELPYKEGPVAMVTSIKIKEGKFFDYWAFLSTSWRQENEEAKKQGLVLSYTIYGAQPKTPSDPDLYLVVMYANFAALDGLDEKMALIDKKIWGSLKDAAKSDADRESIRTILGTEVIREMDFKK
ncbi:MAG: hypothetical protein QOD56_2292 [Gammaproteobacteria bacterium]|jgi:hypothetical protein|nr:hypothetical protein [Gammaproteobacteria bacterium]